MKKKKVLYYIGTSGWNYPSWKGKFYPKGLPVQQWFDYYATFFNVVEVNATFYRLFSNKVFKKWHNQAPKGFYYILKVHRLITHTKKLIQSKKLIKNFCNRVSILKEKLGLILLQLDPNTAYNPERLKKAILAFDNPKKVVVEFRNKKWLTKEVKLILKQIGCIFCCTDSPDLKMLDWVTSDIAYIRLHGRKRWYNYRYTKKDLNDIVSFARKLEKKGAKHIYIFFNNDYYAYSIQNALYLSKIIKQLKSDVFEE